MHDLLKNVCMQRKTRQKYVQKNQIGFSVLGTRTFWIILYPLYFPNCLVKLCCLYNTLKKKKKDGNGPNIWTQHTQPIMGNKMLEKQLQRNVANTFLGDH